MASYICSVIYCRVQPGCGGQICTEDSTESDACFGTNPVHCVWNSWGEWGPCFGSCGMTDTKTRTRTIRYL